MKLSRVEECDICKPLSWLCLNQWYCFKTQAALIQTRLLAVFQLVYFLGRNVHRREMTLLLTFAVLLTCRCLWPQYLHFVSESLRFVFWSEFFGLDDFSFSFLQVFFFVLSLSFLTSSVFLSSVPWMFFICCKATSLDVHIWTAFFKSSFFSLSNLNLCPWFFRPITNPLSLFSPVTFSFSDIFSQ